MQYTTKRYHAELDFDTEEEYKRFIDYILSEERLANKTKAKLQGNIIALDCIEAWQKNPMLHPLTCGNDSKHKPLIGTIRNGQVVLRCLDCDYIQKDIPKCIFEITYIPDDKQKEIVEFTCEEFLWVDGG